ncbi:hypothetical protein WCX49_07230 [Sulfurimonas sp. HSL-1656]
MQNPDAAALFETIILPGFAVLSAAALLLLVYAAYLNKKHPKDRP